MLPAQDFFKDFIELLAQQSLVVKTGVIVQTRLLRCCKGITNFASGVWSQVRKDHGPEVTWQQQLGVSSARHS